MNLDIFTQSSLVIQIHIVFALSALALGTFVMLRKKGTRGHKFAGRVFLPMMIVVAVSSLFIRQINDGSFSWIHIFVPLTFFAAFETAYYVRRGNIRRHRSAVRGLFFGALLIPGAFSMLPGRTMWMILFG